MFVNDYSPWILQELIAYKNKSVFAYSYSLLFQLLNYQVLTPLIKRRGIFKSQKQLFDNNEDIIFGLIFVITVLFYSVFLAPLVEGIVAYFMLALVLQFLLELLLLSKSFRIKLRLGEKLLVLGYQLLPFFVLNFFASINDSYNKLL